MNKRQKLVQERFLDNEEAVINRLKQVYGQSLKDVTGKISDLDKSIADLQKALADVNDDEVGELARAFLGRRANISPAEAKETLQSMLQSKVYQKRYQEALKGQIDGIMDKMHGKEYKVVSDYLKECYEDGFIGTMFDLQGQGIPLCFPLDQEAMVRAVQLDSKISQGLYSRLGEDVAILKKKITAQVSRGIATGMPFQQVARGLSAHTNIGYNNAVRIARTEGHRIQVQGTMDACYKAREKGADVVKQWDSTLDGKTRESHARVDGEIRELDKPFSNGLMFPGDPSGGAAEVVNCRCALLQRARWALDEAELETLKERAAFYGLDKADTFDDYKSKYLKAADQIQRQEKFIPAKTKAEAEQFAKSLGVNADYSKYDISVANAVNEAMQRAVDEFGIHALDSLKTIRKDEKSRAGGFDWFSGNLSLSGVSGKNALFKMGEKTRKANQRYASMGMKYFSAEGDLCTIHHELGHAIHSSLGGSLDTASTKLDKEIISFMRGRRTKTTSDVSYYATLNDRELVAECVAQYFDGTESETTIGIIDILKKYGKNK